MVCWCGVAAAGHRMFAINPDAVDRYRHRYAPSGEKSDSADALVVAHGGVGPYPSGCVRAGVRNAARLR
jgi:hypothetical protein